MESNVGLQPDAGVAATNDKQSAPPKPPPAISTSAAGKPEKIRDDKYLHNVIKVHDKVLSGGQPHGEQAFQALQAMGIKTIISVDGAMPEVALAKKYGLRYVHMPHGYDGVPEERVKELAKAVRELEGPIYIHCHHGKHRSPAASAVACVAAGLIDPDRALSILEVAGTSKNYRGLYESAKIVRKLDAPQLEALQVDYKEVADVPPLADAMIEIEVRFDHLKLFAQNHWQPLQDHPDLSAAHEALLLREQYTELLRTDDLHQQPQRFQTLMKEAEHLAQTVENAFHAWNADKSDDKLKSLTAALNAVTQNCADCHKDYRDVPLREKGKK